MATVVKDFKVKSGLVVEGANATVGGFDVLKKENAADEQYIISLVTGGGGSDSDNTPNTVVLRDGTGSFAAGTITAETGFSGNLTGDVTGNVTGNLTGDVTGTVSSLSNHDTDDLAEGSRLYFTDTRAKDAVAAALGDGIEYETGSFNVKVGTGLEIGGGTGNEIVVDTTVIATKQYVDDQTTTDVAEGTNLYYTDSRARDAVSAGNGIDYVNNTGEISADLGFGLQFDVNGQIEIDDNVVATDQNVTDAVSTHSSLTTGVHGVTGDVVGTSDVQTLTNKAIGSGTTLAATVDANGFTITDLAEPTQASDAATKGYVDAVAEGLHVHASVVALADSNITLPTAPATVDGVTLSINDRILLVGQTAPAENGIYVVINGDLARAADYNTAGEIQAGDFVFVSGGTVYGSTGWVQENTVTTLGTDPIEWDQFSGAGTYTAGNGLTLTGTQFAIDTEVTATKEYVNGAIDDHELVTSGIHGVTGDIVGTSDTQTLTNKTLGASGAGTTLGANLDAVNTYKVVNLVDPTSAQDAATKKYVDDEIGTVNSTINALTTADIAEDVAGPLYFTDERAQDAFGALLVNGTQTNITVTYDDANGTLSFVAENGVGDSTTDDLSEGSNNLYFTDDRAQDAVAAAIAAGTHENITITYDDNAGSISFVAENGVADSDTDDLAEGTTNLYFTNARAVTALEAVVPNFTEIDINSVATQVAAASSGDATQSVVAYSFDAESYRSAKFLVKVAYGSHTEVSEVLITLDSSDNIAITEYAVVGTNGSASVITADVSGGNVRLLVTPTNNGSTIKVMGTLLV